MEGTTKIIKENQDSIEIGAASRGGVLKVYFDASKPEEAKEKITRAMELRRFAQIKLELP